MEILGNSLNQPVNFYTKNTDNTINMAIDTENQLYNSNIFANEFGTKEQIKKQTSPIKKKRKSKRLNTIDTDYLPDEIMESVDLPKKDDNFFIEQENKSKINDIKKNIEKFIVSTPFINYFFLKQKQYNLKKTVAKLNDINQNVDELLSTVVPYGEESNLYKDIAKNLTQAANIIGQSNKQL
jgi:hypothetical protein